MTGEQGVLARQGDRADGVLDRIGVEFETAVFEESGETRPVAVGIADVAGQGGAGGDSREVLLEPGCQGLEDRLRVPLSRRQPETVRASGGARVGTEA